MTSSSIRSRSGRDSSSHAMHRKAEHTSGDKMKNETAATAAVSFEIVKKRWNAVLRQSRRGRVKGAKSPLRVQSSSFSNFLSLKSWTGSGAKRLFRHADEPLRDAAARGVIWLSGCNWCSYLWPGCRNLPWWGRRHPSGTQSGRTPHTDFRSCCCRRSGRIWWGRSSQTSE